MNRRVFAAVLGAVLAAAALGTPPAEADGPGFVRAAGTDFAVDGVPFRFLGANAPTLTAASPAVVDDVLDAAAAMRLTVLRVFPFVDAGAADGSVPTVHPDLGVRTRWWDPAAGRPVFDDGPDGLQRVDHLVAAAARRGLRVQFVLTDNDRGSGGMEQYLAWFGLRHHDTFYSDTRVREAYRDWVDHLVGRVNTETGVAYRDDPTIFAWELADGPRCAGVLPQSGGCTPATITGWAREMSDHLQLIDPNHLVGVGDEGFITGVPNSPTDPGVDHVALSRLPGVDFATYQIHTDAWGQPDSWVQGTWTVTQVGLAMEDQQPIVLTDIDRLDPALRDDFYAGTLGALRADTRFGGQGWFVHTLAGHRPDGTPEPDVDGMSLYHPSGTATVVATLAASLAPPGPGGTAPLAPGTPVLDGTPFQGKGRLRWRPALDADAGDTLRYRVLRVDGDQVTEVAASSLAFADVTGLEPGHRYTFVVTATDTAGLSSPPSGRLGFVAPALTGDTSPPTSPGEIQVSGLTGTGVSLSWPAGTDDVLVRNYVVSLQQADGRTRDVADPAAPAVRLSYLRPGTRYDFLVRTRDERGILSDPAPVTVTTPHEPGGDTTPPTPPGRPVVVAVTPNSISLSWTPPTDDVAVDHQLLQRLDGGGWQTWVPLTAIATAVDVGGLRPATTFTLSLVAVDAAGNVSPRSDAVTVTTAALPDGTPPSPPGTPVVDRLTATSARLTWAAARDDVGVTGYRVFRLDPPDGTPVASTVAPEATLSGLTPGRSTSYAVEAVDAAGNVSARSGPVTVTTPAAGSGCRVAYREDGWGTGLTAAVTVTNTGSAPINGWTLSFTWPEGQRLQQGWSATWTQTGTGVTAVNLPWNATIPAGGSVGIGFTATTNGTEPTPTAFRLNGDPCTAGP